MDMSSAIWRKLSYSGTNGGNCIEIAAAARLPAGTARTRKALCYGSGRRTGNGSPTRLR